MPETKNEKKIEAKTNVDSQNIKAKIMADAEEKRHRKYLAYLNYQNGIGQAK